MSFTYGGKVTTGPLTLYTPYQWMNVNLRVQFGSYITLSVWQGIFNLDPSPELTITLTNPSPFTTMAVDI